jgi:hypothetical protein
MYSKNLITVPRIAGSTPGKDVMEWQIPGKVSVALALIGGIGYTMMAKIRVEKKHWWSRAWKTMEIHAPTPSEVMQKGLELLEDYGFSLDHDLEEIEELLGDREQS